MEPVDLLDYKDALLQAAWEADVQDVGTTEWYMSGMSDHPLVTIGVWYYSEQEEKKQKFISAFERMTGVRGLIGVLTSNVDDARDSSCVLIRDGEWVWDDR